MSKAFAGTLAKRSSSAPALTVGAWTGRRVVTSQFAKTPSLAAGRRGIGLLFPLGLDLISSKFAHPISLAAGRLPTGFIVFFGVAATSSGTSFFGVAASGSDDVETAVTASASAKGSSILIEPLLKLPPPKFTGDAAGFDELFGGGANVGILDAAPAVGAEIIRTADMVGVLKNNCRKT